MSLRFFWLLLVFVAVCTAALPARADDVEDVPIPGQNYTFGVLNRAQALGDFDVLAQRGRRLLRVHLGKDVGAGLARLLEVVRGAVG